MYHIQKIRGIDKSLGEKLKQNGIENTEELLEKASKPEGREALAEKIGVSTDLVLEWANRADILRIDGIDQDYSDLLEVAGVDTVVELARRVPENLHKKLVEVNKERKVAYKFAFFLKYPRLDEVQDWVEQAKKLPRKLFYEDVKMKPAVLGKQEKQDQLRGQISRSLPIRKIEGIGPVYAEKLAEVGFKTCNDLLEAGKSKEGREEIAEKTGISQKLILEWVNLADLIRIKGVSEEYSDLLEEAGVDTVVELSRRNPLNLHAKILEVNEEKKLVRRPPSLGMITDWIEQSKKLPRLVDY